MSFTQLYKYEGHCRLRCLVLIFIASCLADGSVKNVGNPSMLTGHFFTCSKLKSAVWRCHLESFCGLQSAVRMQSDEALVVHLVIFLCARLVESAKRRPREFYTIAGASRPTRRDLPQGTLQYQPHQVGSNYSAFFRHLLHRCVVSGMHEISSHECSTRNPAIFSGGLVSL